MNDLVKVELLKIALKYLDQALMHITEIKDCEHSSTLGKIIHNAINFGESICEGNVKDEEHKTNG